MPEEQFGASTTWTAPFAVTSVSYFVTGGGGGGYRDDAGEGSNGNGGGGGSGGYLTGSMNVTPGAQYSVVVGGGGAIGYYTQGGFGGASSFGGNQATGGNPGKDGQGGGGGSPNGVDGEEDKGQNTSATGKGGTSLDTPFGDGGNGNRNDKDNASAGNGGRVRISYTYNAPTITYFNGSTQTSSSGIPSNTGTLSWATTFANSVSISEVGGVAATGSNTSVNTGLQSVAGSNSPASKTYTLTASGPGGTVTASATIYVYNDNTPSNGWTTSFSNLEPNTTVDLVLGTLSGVDMPTTISTSGTGNFIGLGGSFSGSRNFNNGETVSLRTTTLPFNTDVSGKTGIYGKENSKTVTVSTPGGSFSVTVTTRAPRIREDFDYADNLDKYPYEDIDLIPNSPTEYLTTAQITANDIEIPMEIKVDKPDAQISINNGTWQNVRST